MRKVINVVKKAAKWYFEQAAKSYAWTPSGIVPYRGE